jgi:hypothetical protein
MKIFYSADCQCGWTYGPTSKAVIKVQTRFHKEIHRLERMMNNEGS